VSLPDDRVHRRAGRAGQLRYFATHAARYAERSLSVSAALRRAEVVFVQRGLYPMGPSLVARPILRFEGRVAFDLDDAVFTTKPFLADRDAFTRWLYGPQQARALLERADAIIVSSAELAAALPPGLPAPTVLPTVPDPQRYQLATHQSVQPAVIGWAGTVGNIQYLEPLRPVFERLARRGLARLEVVSSQPWDGPASFHEWTLDGESELFQRFAVGIMPLPDTPYTRAKAGFKLLQYMAAGLPVVASPVGINRDLVNQSGAGFLASSVGEWEEALDTLSRDVELRRTLGLRGRSFIERYADLGEQANVLTQLLSG
jgi:hypothetical protein